MIELKYRRTLIETISALIVIIILLGTAYAYTGNWPPAVIVESKSMQHGNGFIFGVINTGDIVGVKRVTSYSDIVTYIQARSHGGPINYGDYGDVIIYRNYYLGEFVIHRAIMYVNGWHNGHPTIAGYNNQSWIIISGTNVIIKNMGYANRNLLIELGSYVGETGIITMGDYNLANSPYNESGYYLAADQNVGIDNSLVNISQVIGIAVGYIPILGVLKLWIEGQTQDIPLESNLIMGAFLIILIGYAIFPTSYFKRKKKNRLKG